jgi:hypothetical protein
MTIRAEDAHRACPLDPLYKFVGGPAETLPVLFDTIFGRGSLKFGAAVGFNDPFEFKFATAAPPSRQALEDWHDAHDPGRSADARDRAWESFQGSNATVGWNTQAVPRYELLSRLYVLCLAQVWDSPLLWAHYASMHHGFCVMLDKAAIDAYGAHQAYGAMGPVSYRPDLPTVRWFIDTPAEKIRAAVFNKSDAWAYEGEFRVVFAAPPGQAPLFVDVDPTLMRGVILGARASSDLIDRALAHQARHPGFVVRQVTSDNHSYALRDVDMTPGVRREAFTL